MNSNFKTSDLTTDRLNESSPATSLETNNIDPRSNSKKIVFVALLIALLIVVGTYFVLNKNIFSEKKHQNFEDKQISTEIDVPVSSPQVKVSNKILMSKGGSVVIKDLDTNEEVNTGIPIEWENPSATWCQGFDWSADGQKVYAFRLNKIYDLKTKELQTLPNKLINPIIAQWNPTGNSIYYSSRDKEGTWLYDLETNVAEKVSDHSLFSYNANHPVSPDGTKILVEKEMGKIDGSNNLYYKYFIQDLKTKTETEILLPEDAKPFSFIIDITWAPSNDTVAFVYDYDVEDKFQTRRTIATFNLLTKQSSRLPLTMTSSRMPIYSPDGKIIIFENESAPQELWRINADGTELSKLEDSSIDFYMHPNFSPDGTKVVFTKFQEGIHEGILGIKVINIDGTNPQIIDSQADCAIWSP